jgi:IS30 family transposase
VSHETI